MPCGINFSYYIKICVTDLYETDVNWWCGNTCVRRLKNEELNPVHHFKKWCKMSVWGWMDKWNHFQHDNHPKHAGSSIRTRK